MQRIRIGNDVMLNLTLKGSKTYDQANIKELRCFLINTTVSDYDPLAFDCCAPHSCHNPYSLHQCGCPSYHVKPTYLACGDHCHDCHAAHNVHTGCNPAQGSGCLRPNYGHPFHCDDHHCHGCYNHLDQCLHCDEHCAHFGPMGCDIVAPYLSPAFKYLAPSKVLPKKNQIQVYFPAKDQHMCGDYKLIVCVVVFEPGWGRCDLHTYTIDYGEVIQLVDDSTAAQGDITVDVDTDSLANTNITDIKIKAKDMYINSNSSLEIGDTDIKGNTYAITVTLENGVELEYDPNNWAYEKLAFYSSKPGAVSANQSTGKLIVPETDDNNRAVITVESTTTRIAATFSVNVIGGGYDYIGYLPVRPFAKSDESDSQNGFERGDQSFENDSQEYVTSTGVENVSLSSLAKTTDLSHALNVTNNVNGQYLWIVTRRPVQMAIAVNGGSEDNTRSYGVQSAMLIPLTKAMHKQYPNDELYYYACPNPMMANDGIGGDTIFVKFED